MAAAGAPLKRQSDIRKRVVTTELRLGHCSFLADRWSILDCPGSVEFSYEMEGALAAVDLAIVVCEPTAGRASSVPLLLKALEEYRLPHLIFVNKIDTLAGSFDDTLAANRRSAALTSGRSASTPAGAAIRIRWSRGFNSCSVLRSVSLVPGGKPII